MSACLRPGSSISGLALAHGVNANLLRKWVGKRLAERSAGLRSFVPVRLDDVERKGAVGSVVGGGCEDDVRDVEFSIGDRPRPACGAGDVRGAGSARGVTHVTAWLPNGVKVVLDCGGSDLGTVLGALAHVPSGR